MGYRQTTYDPPNRQTSERPCWREILLGALSGIYPTDQQLEQMMDHLERMP